MLVCTAAACTAANGPAVSGPVEKLKDAAAEALISEHSDIGALVNAKSSECADKQSSH